MTARARLTPRCSGDSRSAFVLPGTAPPELGRALAVAQNLRSKADYSVAGASEGDAADAMSAMERILEFARPRLISAKGTDDG